MRLCLLLLTLLFIPIVAADDLNFTIKTDGEFNLSETSDYDLFIKNLNGTAEENIEITISYWISDLSDNVVTGYPKNTSAELKSQKTISRQWTPKTPGDFKVCGKISYTTTQDDNENNNEYCTQVFVAGELPVEENTTSEPSEDEVVTQVGVLEEDSVSENNTAQTPKSNTNTTSNTKPLTLQKASELTKPQIMFREKSDATKTALLIFAIASTIVIVSLLIKTYRGSDKPSLR